MFAINRKALAALGAAAFAAATTTLFALPAQAAATGKAQVLGSHHSTVKFTAAAGKRNTLVITISGWTVTLNDTVAIKAGKGCTAVKGDRTKVRCTTSRKPTELSIALGDKSDKVYNRTAVHLYADGGSGNDWVAGGTGDDIVLGGSGNDTVHGGGGHDDLHGDHGNDKIYGGAGDDAIAGGPGRDRMYGEAGDDGIVGGELDGDVPDSADVISGGPGRDVLIGQDGDDRINGGTGNDTLIGGRGSDELVGGGGTDDLRQ
jgi:Ca2+-binding RTX toxin-like protein